jgi:hypothetical protein
MLTVSAPNRYPSISFLGFGSSSITVDAVRSVGFNAAVNDRATIWPMRL